MAFLLSKNYYLGPVPGAHADNAHLFDTPDCFIQSWTVTDNGIEAQVAISAASSSALAAKWAAIDDQVYRALTNGQPHALEPIIFSIQLLNDEWRYIDVHGGFLSKIRQYPDARTATATLTLLCRPLARGAAYTATLAPVAGTSIVNGQDAVLLVADVPGDAEALVALTLSDESTGGAAINHLRIGRHALRSITAGDIEPILPLTASGAGVLTTPAADTLDDQIITTTTTADWQTIGYVTQPTALTRGMKDLYARVSDDYSLLSAPVIDSSSSPTEGIIRRQNAPDASSSGVTSAGSITQTFTLPALEGALLTIQLGIRSNTANPGTPSGWTLGASEVHGSVAASSYQYWKIAAGGETSVTVTWTGSHDAFMVLTEWYGLAHASPVDVTADASNTATTSHVSGTTASTAQSNALSLTMHTVSTTTQPTIGAGWINNFVAGNGFLPAYRVESSTGTKSHTATTGSSQSSAGTIIVFKGRTTAVEDLASGIYQYRIVPVDADGEGTPSDVSTVTVTANDAVLLVWSAPTLGTPTDYRVYWDRGSGWRYLATGNTYTHYVHYTETGATVINPPNISAVAASWRAQVSLGSGTTRMDRSYVASSQMGGALRHLVYLGTYQLPDDWRITVEVRRTAGTPETVEIDGLYLFDHASNVWAEVPTLDLDTPRDWLITHDRYGAPTGILYETGTSTEAGQAHVSDALTFAPGDNLLTLHAAIQGRVSEMADTEFSIASAVVTPRYRLSAGGTR